MLPSASSAIFKDSSFFLRNGVESALPTPAQVRASQLSSRRMSPPPVPFESLGLIVKYGKDIAIAEGQCLWAIHKIFHSKVPVPEVYGWCEDSEEFFIYMELANGVTLENRWDTMSTNERINVCEQIRDMLTTLRQLKQDPQEQFVGHINHQRLLDIVFTDSTKLPAGPFVSVREFHDWLSRLIKRGMEIHCGGDVSLIPPDPMRPLLPDDSPITFTYADLHPSNIIVTAEQPCRVLALVDWHQSGWYPDYWEYCKAAYTAEPGGEWEREYLPRILDAWAFYPRSLGY